MSIYDIYNRLYSVSTEGYHSIRMRAYIRSIDIDEPRSRVNRIYTSNLGNQFIAYINNVLYAEALLSDAEREAISFNGAMFPTYPSIIRVNATSYAINEVLGTTGRRLLNANQNVLATIYSTGSRANYEGTVQYMDTTDVAGCTKTMLGEIAGTYKMYKFVEDNKKTFSIIVVTTNDDWDNMIASLWMAIYESVYDTYVSRLLPQDLAERFKPTTVFETPADDADYASAEAWMCDREDTIKAIIQEAEEKRRQEALARLEEARANAVAKSLDALSSVTIGDNRADIMKNLSEDIANYVEYIKQYEEKVRTYQAKLEAKKTEYNSYAFRDDESLNLADVFKDFIGWDKSIKLCTVRASNRESIITLICTAPIEFWEEDELVNWKNNKDIYNKLEIITGGRYKLITSCRIELNPTRSVINGLQLDETSQELVNAEELITHPHVGRYGCFGNNENSIRQAMRNRDFYTALCIINQSIYQLNLTDGCVINSLCSKLDSCDTYKTFLDTETGEMVSLIDIYTARAAQAPITAQDTNF